MEKDQKNEGLLWKNLKKSGKKTKTSLMKSFWALVIIRNLSTA